MALLVFVRSMLDRVLPVRDILILDEEIQKINLLRKKSESKAMLIYDVEAADPLLEEQQVWSNIMTAHCCR